MPSMFHAAGRFAGIAAVSAFALAASMAASLPASAQDDQLFFYNWTNYFPPELLQKFEEETGIRVTLDGYDSNETLLAKLQAGASGYDVIVPSDYMVDIMAREGLLMEINAAEMENFGNVLAPHDDPWYDPGRVYSAPYMWGTTGFSYDADAVPEGVEIAESWWTVFDPEGPFAGRVAMLNDAAEVYYAAAMYLDIDKCTENPEEAGRIYELLAAQMPAVALYNSDGTIERMIAGEVAAHHQWNGAAHRTKQGRPSVVYVYPEEGVNMWADNFAIPVGAPHPENARIFIDWMLLPENIAIASNYTGYNGGIAGADAFMDETLADDPAVNTPAEYADRLDPAPSCGNAAIDLRDRVWTRLKS